MENFDFEFGRLTEKANEAIYNIYIALVSAWKKIINNPGNINKTKFIVEVKQIIKILESEIETFVNVEIPEAYISGIKVGDKILKNFPIKGNQNINVPLLIQEGKKIKLNPIDEDLLNILKKYPQEHTTFIDVFRAAAKNSLSENNLQILRKSEDYFRDLQIKAGEKLFNEADNLTRIQYSQEMLNQAAADGFKSVRYKNGAKYGLDSYVEMVGRTVLSRCSLQASLNRYSERGYNLGIVSSHFRCCDHCAVYENQILSLDGMDKRYSSLMDAEAHLLFHCNCRHNIMPYFSGIEDYQTFSVNESEQNLINNYGYQEAQKMSYNAQIKQRYIERQIRKYKKLEAVSLTESEKKYNKMKISQFQKKQRDHLEENKFLKRKYIREQIKSVH